jgi:hypothetical protein
VVKIIFCIAKKFVPIVNTLPNSSTAEFEFSTFKIIYSHIFSLFLRSNCLYHLL